jgi:hypothetical protein
MRDKLVASLILGLTGLLFLHCAPVETADAPSQAVKRFYQHLNDGAYTEAKGLYNAEVLGVLNDPSASDDDFRAWARQETKSGIISEVKIINSAVEETTADVDFELVYEDGTLEQRRVSLTQEDGAWKLGFIS